MAPRLKPIKSAEELSAIPLDEPVLVELEPEKTGIEQEDGPEQKAGTSEDQGIESLRKELEASKEAARVAQEATDRERQRAREIEKDRLRLAQEAEEARTHASSAEAISIETGLEAAQRERDNARKAIKQAFESGDSEALADAQERLARASTDLREYERAQADIEARKAKPERTEVRQNLSPEESIDANPNLMPAERVWLKSHLEAYIDPARNNDLGLAYQMATREGHRRGTPEYFDYIETFMGYKKAPKAETIEDEDDTMVAAPVSRENRSPSGQPSSSRIKLTPEQREFARTMGLTDIQYAQQVAALDRDKKSNPQKYGMTG